MVQWWSKKGGHLLIVVTPGCRLNIHFLIDKTLAIVMSEAAQLSEPVHYVPFTVKNRFREPARLNPTKFSLTTQLREPDLHTDPFDLVPKDQ